MTSLALEKYEIFSRMRLEGVKDLLHILIKKKTTACKNIHKIKDEMMMNHIM